MVTEGIYVFGGKDENGKVSNLMKILTFSNNKVLWEFPKIKGTPPSPRFGHTMLLYEKLGLLIIYGGTNGKSEDKVSMENPNHVFVFSLELMAWMATLSVGKFPKSMRYNHAAAIMGDSLVIFGGLEAKTYASDELLIADIGRSYFRIFVMNFFNRCNGIDKKA